MDIKLRNGGQPGAIEPSAKQKARGNYAKGHTVLHGMRISVENDAGTARRGVDPDGNSWEQKLVHPYGYIRGMTGRDKDKLDVFLGPKADDPSLPVFVIDQNKKGSDQFDEHKVMLGFESPDDAVLEYHLNYQPGWDGFRGVTPMSLKDFKTWGYAGKSGKRKPAADYVKFLQDRALGVATAPEADEATSVEASRVSDVPGFAEGGSTDRAFVGYRSAGRRKEKNNDREAAKGMPLSALRGVVAGTAGLPGDLEGLLRTIYNLPSVNPAQALMRRVTGPVSMTPAMPTSDFYNEWLPGRQAGAANRAAEVLGNVAGMDPLQVSRVARPAVRAAERGAGALGQALERAEPAMERVMERHLGPILDRNGLGADLLRGMTRGVESFAVKPKGGNWTSQSVKNAVERTVPYLENMDGNGNPSPVRQWMDKRLSAYIRNQLGTADDPMLKLEQQGRLHLDRDDLLARSREHGAMYEVGRGVGDERPGDGRFIPADEQFHSQATGRDHSTPWENLADSVVGANRAGDYQGREFTEDWVNKLDPETPLHYVRTQGFGNLGFDHVRDYLQQATDAGRAAQLYGRDPGAYAGEQGRQVGDLIARNLDINPDDLSKMSLSDVVSKTSDWNKFIYKAKQLEDMNKGVKSVLKSYPETGHQWVELAPEGLKAEGDAMRHCVGGYCSSVEDGSTRILSLRDKSGKPYTTIELSKRTPYADYDRSGDAVQEALHSLGVNEDDVPVEIFDAIYENFGKYPEDPISVADTLGSLLADAGLVSEDAFKTFQAGLRVPKDAPWDIRQIKGPANRAPSADVLPMVQDFVKSMGPWGRIDDLSNAGLIRQNREFSARTPRGANVTVPEGLYTRDELQKFFLDAGETPEQARTWVQGMPQGMYASGGSVQPDYGSQKEPARKAAGGSVGNPFVNGWGFTGNAAQQPQQQAANPLVQQALSPVAAYQKQWQAGQKGLQLPDPSNGPLTSQQALPTLSSVNNGIDPVTGMPVYNLSDPQSMMALQWVRQAGDVGKMDRGLGASAMSTQQTMDLAKRFGYDTSAAQQWLDAQPKTRTVYSSDETQTPMEVAFDPNTVSRPEDAAAELDRVYQRLSQADQFSKMLPAGAQNPYSAGIDPYQELQARLNNSMKDIYTIEGFSGWNPSAKDPRQGTAGMYRLEGGALRPVSPGVARHLPQTDDGTAMKQFLASALSIVGGPLLGAAGLGLTPAQAGVATGAANYAITGNPASLAGALGGAAGSWAGGALGSQLGGATGQQLGSWAGGQAGKYLGQTAVKS